MSQRPHRIVSLFLTEITGTSHLHLDSNISQTVLSNNLQKHLDMLYCGHNTTAQDFTYTDQIGDYPHKTNQKTQVSFS